MTPVYQKHTDINDPTKGDCLSACIASMLDLPLERVPGFCLPGLDWPDNYIQWLWDYGLVAVELNWPARENSLKLCMRVPKGTFFIAEGRSPRGDWQHAVVAMYNPDAPEGWELAHDPNPAGGGIIGLDRLTFFSLQDQEAFKTLRE